jgi:ElaB/YqjD/DUF883 family membrane-anchored ribosome-binding protein
MAEQRTSESGGTSPTQERGVQGRDAAHEVSTQVGETARQVGETASAYYEQGREQLGRVGQSLEETIQAKPVQSVLIAAGIGLLMALLWKK